MMKNLNSLLLFLILFTLNSQAQVTDKSQLLRDYFDAYNQHKVEEVVSLVSGDFKMYSVSSDTMTIDINGKEKLRNWLTSYFKDLPNVTSEMGEISESGNYVSFIETAYWGENRSQSSLAVYEIWNGKIKRVWYYY